MLCLPIEVDQRSYFAVRRFGRDLHDPDVFRGILADQFLDGGDSRVFHVGDAEEQFVLGIVEFRVRADRLMEGRIRAANRLEDRDAGRKSRILLAKEQSSDTSREREELVDSGNSENDGDNHSNYPPARLRRR